MEFNYKWNLSDLEKVEPNGLSVFSCFAGGGGSSQGYKMAGYDVIGCNEIDPRQMEIYKHNLNPKYSYLEDIRTFRERDDLPKELFNLHVLDASFPCSLFAQCNLDADNKKGVEVKFREGQSMQTLDDLAFETIHLVDKLRPQIAIFENVKGLLQEKNRWYVEQIYSQFNNIGYKICHQLINCADLGVPQKRERVFFFAVRDDIDIPTSDLFGTEPSLDLNIREDHVMFKDIYEKDVCENPLSEYYTEIWGHRKHGDADFSCTNGRFRNKPNTGFGQNYVYQEGTCNTLTSKKDVIVLFDEPRYLNDSERLKIGSWSQDYDFLTQKCHYVLGMSVPPLAMYRIAKEIEIQWLKK